jgi:catechol 2,3-dioxygenase-like lactoylglutathione lyase family enzyme
LARDTQTFHDPQVNLYVNDAEISAKFYRDFFGFRETFRTPKTGTPIHIELQLGSMTLGVATTDSVGEIHGFKAGGGPPRAEVVLWTDDVDREYASLTERGVRPLSAPHDFVETVRGAWVVDPDGNPIQIVSKSKAR